MSKTKKTKTPATPATETPATPATETPATPATETPATPARGSLLAKMMLATKTAATKTPGGRDAILALRDGDETLTIWTAASIRAFADDVYSGRTITITDGEGDSDEFLVRTVDSLCHVPDLTPAGCTDGKTYRARLIARVIVPHEGSLIRFVALTGDARNRLASMGIDRPATGAERDAIFALRKNRVGPDGRDVRNRIHIATETETRDYFAPKTKTPAPETETPA